MDKALENYRLMRAACTEAKTVLENIYGESVGRNYAYTLLVAALKMDECQRCGGTGKTIGPTDKPDAVPEWTCVECKGTGRNARR